MWVPWHKKPSYVNHVKPKMFDPDAVQKDCPHLLQTPKTKQLHNVNVMHGPDLEIGYISS